MAIRVADTTAARSSRPFIVELYRSALGKKYLMAISGVVWLGYVFAHMVGNLKLYMSPEAFNEYAEFLRRLLYPIVPEHATLNIMRAVLILALVVHVVTAWQLTIINQRARPERYQSKRDYVAADFAARTMRWTGVIVLLFMAYHLADLTWGWVNPDPTGTVYDKVIASFSQPVVAGFYVVANIALGFHLYHGAWSLFQSLGLNNRRFNHWRRIFAVAFTAIVVVGNLSFPIAVQLGLIG
ncbi:MAG: succinate dehydrogenase cytochrome b subunit [Nitriliruptoraceae bacterium]